MKRLHFTLSLLNADASNREPAKNLSVTIHQLGADDKPAEVLVDGRPDAEGRVVFFISDWPPRDSVAQQLPLPKIRFTVRDVDGDAIGHAASVLTHSFDTLI